MNRALAICASLLAITLVFAACSSSSDSGAESPTGSAPNDSTPAPDDVPETEENPAGDETGFALALAQAQVDCDTLAPWSDGIDLMLWVVPETSADELTALQDELASSPRVERVVFLDQDATFAEFQDFYKDNPSLSDGITPQDIGTRFEIAAREPADENAAALLRDFEAREMTDRASVKPEVCAAPDVDFGALCAEFGLPSTATVFLSPDASQANIDRMQALIVDTGLFDPVMFTSQEEALVELGEMFEGIDVDNEFAQPSDDPLEGLEASDMPTSFEFEVVPGTAMEVFLDEVRQDQDVFEVVYFDGGCIPDLD